MEGEVLIDNEHATLIYHPVEKIVHHVFHKFAYGEPVRELMLRGADLLKEHSAAKWLSDDRECGVMTAEDITWAQSVWEPLAIANGWKYWAIVRPVKAVIRLSTHEFAERYKMMGLSVELFDEPETAFNWLRDCP